LIRSIPPGVERKKTGKSTSYISGKKSKNSELYINNKKRDPCQEKCSDFQIIPELTA